ncbi:hypothetical protein [Shewanella ulleungensis]|uniref:hypothetical protein n=1 Tax=Shewanella ulleungensis TaxID=2282699 RepID=UPI003D79AC18
MKTVAIKVQTKSGERYFYGFGKSGQVQTAWSISGAKLFLENANDLTLIVNHIKSKKKKVTLATVGEVSAPRNDLVWMTREEFNHYMAIQQMKTVNLDFIREFALSEMQRSKAAMNSSFDIGDEDDGHFFKVDAIEWAQLARGLQREITKLGGL